MNDNKRNGMGVYHMSEAEARAEWTGETIEQAQAAIDADKAEPVVFAGNFVIARRPVFGRMLALPTRSMGKC